MKICKFCGSENIDGAGKCTACGGNEFKNKCEKCGTVYSEGMYCPKCGIKAGQKAKTCPKCGAEYFSVACPDCGYSVAGEKINTESKTVVEHRVVVENAPTPKKKVTIWTILLWIFFLPIMATIAIARSSMKKKVKIGLIAAIWIVFVIAGVTNKSEDTDKVNDSEPAVTATVDKSVKDNESHNVADNTASTVEDASSEKENNASEEDSADPTSNPTSFADGFQNVVDSFGDLSSTVGGLVTGYGSYEEIYTEYSNRLVEGGKTELAAYKAEAQNHKGDINALAELSNQGVSRLADIETEGAEKMAEFMTTAGLGVYSDYESWALKLYEVYETEAGKIYDEYFKDCTGGN